MRAATVTASRKKWRQPPALEEVAGRLDHGPVHQRKSRRLEVVDARDPSRPNGGLIRRARVRDPLRRMVKAGHLSYRLYVAADQFRDDCQKAVGGRDMADALAAAAAGLPTSSPPWTRSNDALPGQYEAGRRVEDAWRYAIGIVAGGVFSWVVISLGTLQDYERCKGMRKGQAAETLRAALERLADHYVIGDVQAPPDWC